MQFLCPPHYSFTPHKRERAMALIGPLALSEEPVDNCLALWAVAHKQRGPGGPRRGLARNGARQIRKRAARMNRAMVIEVAVRMSTTQALNVAPGGTQTG